MDSKHRRTLAAVSANPVRADIESMLAAAGGEVTEGAGSRMRVALNGARAVFHRPHPESERASRRFGRCASFSRKRG